MTTSSTKTARAHLGQLACFDQHYLEQHAPAIKRLTHRWFRARVLIDAGLPATPFVAVGNHSGSVLIPDTIIWLSHYAMLHREPRMASLTHHAVFDYYPHGLALALSKMGALRATASNAFAALEQGFALQIYPGGDRDACRPCYRANHIEFNGKTSYIKIAQRARVPIVPVVSYGAHRSLCILNDGHYLAKLLRLDKLTGLEALPLSLCLPWGITLGPIPYLPLPVPVTIKVLSPIDPSGDLQSVDRHIRNTMQQTINELRSSGRKEETTHAKLAN